MKEKDMLSNTSVNLEDKIQLGKKVRQKVHFGVYDMDCRKCGIKKSTTTHVSKQNHVLGVTHVVKQNHVLGETHVVKQNHVLVFIRKVEAVNFSRFYFSFQS